MVRIYKASVTNEFKIRTVFFNGEVRTTEIEILGLNDRMIERLKEYQKLGEDLRLNTGRTRVEFDGIDEKIERQDLYQMGCLEKIEYIDDINIQIANRVQTMRDTTGMTQADIEKKTGIHQAEISKIERGIGNPSISTLARIANCTGYRLSVDFEDKAVRKEVMPSLAAAPYLKIGKYQGEYNIDDIVNLSEDVKIELIDGYIYDLAQPGIKHQRISLRIAKVIDDYIKENKGDCEVLQEVGVVFDEDDKNYVVPDIVIVCDRNKLQEKYVCGAPDFVLEIVSPGNKNMDYIKKLSLYLDGGVKEYWILDPYKERLIIYDVKNDYIPSIHTFDEKVGVGIYDGKLKIDLSKLR